jgi:hypothetical protein
MGWLERMLARELDAACGDTTCEGDCTPAATNFNVDR